MAQKNLTVAAALVCVLVAFVAVAQAEKEANGLKNADKEKVIGIYGDDPYVGLFNLLEKADKTIRDINHRINQVYNVKNWFHREIRESLVGKAFTNLKNKIKDLLKLNKPKQPRQPQDVMQLYEDTLNNGCPGVQWQQSIGADWTRIPDVLLRDALNVDYEGVIARGCLSVEDQKQFLFGEYKFLRSNNDPNNLIVDPTSIVANDKAPLMSFVARQGARKYRQLELRKPDRQGCSGAAIKECLDATRAASLTELAAVFPWAVPYVEQNCTWVFNTAGQGYAHLCYIYGSVTENIVFWGSPIGNQGFSGSYDAKVWDHMLAGVMETFEAGQIERLTQYPGQFHLLNRWSGNYYRISRDCYMLDYVQGHVAQSLKFAVIAPTRYTTLDYRSAMKSICQYATLVIKTLDGQKVFPPVLGKFIKAAWLDLVGATGEELHASICQFNSGIDPNATANMEGEILTDDEGVEYKPSNLACLEEQHYIDTLASAAHGNPASKAAAKQNKLALEALRRSPRYLNANCKPTISPADLNKLLAQI